MSGLRSLLSLLGSHWLSSWAIAFVILLPPPPIIYIVTDISLLARLEGRSLFSFRLRGNGSSIPEERSGRCGWERLQTSFLSQGQQLVKDFKMCLLWSLKTIPVFFPKSSVNTDTNRSRVIKPYECRMVAPFQLKPLDSNIPFLPSKTSERLHLFSQCHVRYRCILQIHVLVKCERKILTS